MDATSYMTQVKPIRVETETAFKNKDNELLFVASQQTCTLDMDTRKIRKIETIDYPKDIKINETLFKSLDYLKLNDIFNKEDFVYDLKVYSQDLDFSRHVNNSVYINYLMNSFDSKFFDEYKITDFEIHFLNETKESEFLEVYKKCIDKNTYRLLIKKGNIEVIRASLNVKEK